jgi:hypothetical protein
MKKALGLLVVIYGIGLSTYFGYWTFKDNAALEYAVQTQRPQIELRHRINVGFEGVWFLLSNIILVSGIILATIDNTKKD